MIGYTTMRTLRDSTLGLQPTDIIPVEQGGLNTTTAAAAASTLNAIKTAELNVANGFLKKDPVTGKAPVAQFPGLTSAGVALSGVTTVNGLSTTTYTLQNYDIGTAYSFAAIGNGSVSGSVTVNPSTYAATFTYTAPAVRTGSASGNDGFTITATTNGITSSRSVLVSIIDLNKLTFTKSDSTLSAIMISNGVIPFTKSDTTSATISVASGYLPFTKSNGTSAQLTLSA